MKAILLAAGKGTRISKRINNMPKSMLKVGDKPLLWNTVKLFKENNIDVTIIVGYHDQEVREALKEFDIKFYYNPFFDVTNSIGSLWFAKNELYDDTIIANVDVFWTQDILNKIKECDKEIFMLSDSSRVKEGDYFFFVEDGKVKRYGKELEVHERNCEYVGISYIKKDFIDKFKMRLEEMINSQKHQKWWEDVLYSFVDEEDINVLDIKGSFWAEIDYFDDYERILDFVNKNEQCALGKE
ncbi:MAG: phosphocholine cytidylyltransferase family protein [Clostridium sp.]|uniref:phosphocholine cytidylyltransferase family protein n=1 Tax=Clostridium sp. TaxID=1506 RepID=UPI002911BAB9|nr:phosphocholine cytidylyltransferase family protein [Clostridium sp.]MDU4320541.1 phosphocholine cytidylyltransferase family protein [Clostridium sp.]